MIKPRGMNIQPAGLMAEELMLACLEIGGLCVLIAVNKLMRETGQCLNWKNKFTFIQCL